jgi:phosphoglycerate dehydrogenase-like enzyme
VGERRPFDGLDGRLVVLVEIEPGRADEDLVALWQMSELRLGILGLGRIGSRVAEVARAGRPVAETEPDPAVVMEVGDVLFTVVNLARFLNVDP